MIRSLWIVILSWVIGLSNQHPGQLFVHPHPNVDTGVLDQTGSDGMVRFVHCDPQMSHPTMTATGTCGTNAKAPCPTIESGIDSARASVGSQNVTLKLILTVLSDSCEMENSVLVDYKLSLSIMARPTQPSVPKGTRDVEAQNHASRQMRLQTNTVALRCGKTGKSMFQVVNSTFLLDGFRITDCSAPNGAVVLAIRSQVTVQNCVIERATATGSGVGEGGGAIFTSQTRLMVYRSVFDGCMARFGGGAILQQTPEGQNTATCHLNITGSIFKNCLVDGRKDGMNQYAFGGAVASWHGSKTTSATILIEDSVVFNNSAVSDMLNTIGAGVAMFSLGEAENTTFRAISSKFLNNSGISQTGNVFGGAISVFAESQASGTDISVEGCVFLGNVVRTEGTTDAYGAAILVEGTRAFSNLSINFQNSKVSANYAHSSSGGTGGPVSVVMYQTDGESSALATAADARIVIADAVIEKNSQTSGGSRGGAGGGLNVLCLMHCKRWSMSVINSNVSLNSIKCSRQSYGGGISYLSIWYPKSLGIFPGLTETIDSPLWQQSSQLRVKGTHILQNSLVGLDTDGGQTSEGTGTGGGIFVRNAGALVENCTFTDNDAVMLGGAIGLGTGGGSLYVFESSFVNNKAGIGAGDVFHQAEGSMMFQNNSVSHTDVANAITLQILQAGIVQLGNSTISCPFGSVFPSEELKSYNLLRLNAQGFYEPVPQSTILLRCIPCAPGTFSVARGALINKDFKHSNCLQCPFGFSCNGGDNVRPAIGSFGVLEINTGTSDTLEMHAVESCQGNLCGGSQCVINYSAVDDSTQRAEVTCCNYGRTGKFCTQCPSGESFSVSSPRCIPPSSCSGRIIIPVGLAVIFLVLSVKIALSYGVTSGRFKPSIYFFQILPLIVTESSGRASIIKQSIASVANFRLDTTDSSVDLCVFPIFDPVEYIAIQYVLPIVLLLSLAAIWAVASSVALIIQNSENGLANNSEIGRRFSDARMMRVKSQLPTFVFVNTGTVIVMIELLLLLYTTVTQTTMQLLRCTNTGEGQNVLVAAATVKCFQPWQYALIFSVVPLLVLFPLGLFFITRLQPSVLDSKGVQQNNGGSKPSQIEAKSRKVVYWKAVWASIRSPFKAQLAWWESVLILRRLLLILLHTFIKNAFSRSLIMALMCCAFFCMHWIVQPFQRRTENIMEALSLLLLMFLAVFSVRLQDLGVAVLQKASILSPKEASSISTLEAAVVFCALLLPMMALLDLIMDQTVKFLRYKNLHGREFILHMLKRWSDGGSFFDARCQRFKTAAASGHTDDVSSIMLFSRQSEVSLEYSTNGNTDQ